MQRHIIAIILLALFITPLNKTRAQEDLLPYWLTSNPNDGYSLHSIDGETIPLITNENFAELDEHVLEVSSTGAHIAIVSINFAFSEGQNSTPEAERQMWLDVFRTIDGKQLYHAALFGTDVYLPTLNEDYNNAVNSTLGEVSFSPDGRYMVWVSPSEPSSEFEEDGRLMLLDLSTNSLREIPDEAGAPSDFNWSPDSRYLHYRAAYFYSTGGGYDSLNSQSFLLESASGTVEALPLGGEREIIAWLDNENIAFTDFVDVNSGFEGIMRYNIESHSEVEILPRSQGYIAPFSSRELTNGNIVFMIENWQGQDQLEDGVYLLDWQTGEVIPLEEGRYDFFDNLPLGTRDVILSDYLPTNPDARVIVNTTGTYSFVRENGNNYLLNYATGETITLESLPENFGIRWSITGENYLIQNDSSLWIGNLDGTLVEATRADDSLIRAILYPIMSSDAPVSCADMLPSRLRYGANAQVIAGTGANNLRTMPYRNADLVDAIPEASPFQVLGGAWCSEGIVWWYVNYDGQQGWTAESADGEYYLEAVN